MGATRRTVAYVVTWLLVGAVIVALGIGTYEVDASAAGKTATRQLVYASEPASMGVAVVDSSSFSVLRTISLGVSLAHFVVLSDRGLVYATAFGNDSGTLFVLTLPDLKLIATVPVGAGAHHLALIPDRSLVLGTSSDGTLCEVYTTTSALAKMSVLGGSSEDVAVAPKYGFALVANSASDAVQEVDASSGKMVNSITGLGKPVKIRVSADQTYAVVTNLGSATVAVIGLPDLKVRASITLGSGPHQLYLDSLKGYAYVGLQNGTLAVVDLNGLHVTKILQMGGEPMDIQPNTSGTQIYVSGGDEVRTVSTNDQSVVQTSNLSTMVHGLLVVQATTAGQGESPRTSGSNAKSASDASNFTCGG
jgi:DNA-binding beta-propeller fold protein YncE